MFVDGVNNCIIMKVNDGDAMRTNMISCCDKMVVNVVGKITAITCKCSEVCYAQRSPCSPQTCIGTISRAASLLGTRSLVPQQPLLATSTAAAAATK